MSFHMKDFLRRISEEALHGYCQKRNIEFQVNAERKPEERAMAFAEYLTALEKEDIKKKQRIEFEFEEIEDLASGKAMRMLIDKAVENNELSSEQKTKLEKMEIRDNACWFRVNLPEIFAEVAFDLEFENAQGWLQLQVQPEKEENVIGKERALGERLAAYYHDKELRGKICKVDPCFEKGGFLCYVAFPQDFVTRHQEYDDDQKLNKETLLNPVFKAYFIYDPKKARIAVKTKGGREQATNIGSIFASAVLEQEGVNESNRVKYDLDIIKNADFRLSVLPKDDIIEAKLTSLQIMYPVQISPTQNIASRLTIDLNQGEVHQEKTMKEYIHSVLRIPWSNITITRAKIWVKIKSSVKVKRAKNTVTVTITSTERSDSCNLGFKEFDQIVAKKLIEWDIDCIPDFQMQAQ